MQVQLENLVKDGSDTYLGLPTIHSHNIRNQSVLFDTFSDLNVG